MARKTRIRNTDWPIPMASFERPETGFEIVTPSEVQSRVDSLDDSWVQLQKSYPNDRLIQNEAKAYKNWRKSIQDSYLSRLFASGTLATLDEWKRRYQWAYEEARKKNPSIDATAPMPSTLITEEKKTPWLWLAVGGIAAGLLLSIAIKK